MAHDGFFDLLPQRINRVERQPWFLKHHGNRGTTHVAEITAGKRGNVAA